LSEVISKDLEVPELVEFVERILPFEVVETSLPVLSKSYIYDRGISSTNDETRVSSS